MSIKIGDYYFEGPYYSEASLENRSGVYAILCGNSNRVIDIGESAKVKSRIEDHDRKDCWKRNCSETIKYAVLYTPDKQQAGRKLSRNYVMNMILHAEIDRSFFDEKI